MTAWVNRRTPVHSGRVVRLVTENVTLENGVTLDMDIIRHPGAAAVVAVAADGGLMMLRQYRHAVGGYIWEIPAGTLNPAESPLECAHRELAEEAGVAAGRMEPMGEIVPVPGYSDERIHLYLARDLAPARQNLDPDELLSTRKIPWGEAMRMAAAGEIIDCKTLCGLFLAGPRLGLGPFAASDIQTNDAARYPAASDPKA